MTGSDDAILEVLSVASVPLSQGHIHVGAEYLGYEISYSTIKRRIANLVDTGFVEVYDETGPKYIVTEQGKKFLEGEFDAREIPEPDD